MKIAICISGLMRTFEETFPSFQKHFLKMNGNVDIFIHTWNTNTINVEKLYHPVKMKIENDIVFPVHPLMHTKNIHNKRNPQNILSMYYKIDKCNQLKCEYEIENNFKYDCVVRFRSDILLEENFTINENNLDRISIPKYADYFGINDQIAYSNSENMNIYSSAFNNLNQYIDDVNMLDPELFLKHHIMTEGLKIKRFPLQYKLMCHGMILDNQSFEMNWLNNVRQL